MWLTRPWSYPTMRVEQSSTPTELSTWSECPYRKIEKCLADKNGRFLSQKISVLSLQIRKLSSERLLHFPKDT